MNSEEYKKYLFHPKIDNYQLLGTLKQEGDYDKIVKILKNISKHPFVKSVLNHNIFPKEFSDIRKQKPIPFSGNYIGEASLYLFVFEQNKSIIESFLALKEDFDRRFLLGDYDAAENVLLEIEVVSGKSIWLIENQILLKEYKDGVKSNWNVVSELSEKVTDPFVLFLIETLSKRAEIKISYFRYVNIINNQVADLKLFPELNEYLFFRLNHALYTDYEYLAYFLFVESPSSIVDRYLLLKETLSEMFSPRFKDQSDILLFITTKLFEIFPKDIQLCQILSILNPHYLDIIPVNDSISNLIKEYSISNYKYCIENCPSIINDNPTIIETYEIYIKSIIETGRESDFVEYSGNIKQILITLLEIYSSRKSIDNRIDFGFKICTSFSSTSWAKQFLSLITSATATNNGNKLFNINYLIYSQVVNPRILYYVKNDRIDEYLKILINKPDLSISATIISNILKGQHDEIISNPLLDKSKKELFYGRALLKSGKFQEAKEHFDLIFQKKPNSPLFEEEIIVNLFRCYIKLNLSKEACCLFVEQFLKNKETTKRLHKAKLIDLLEGGDIEKLQDLIELPIFYKIASIDSYQQYVAYDIFLENQSITRPTELISNIKELDDKMLFFLKEVCTIEIMHHSYHFNGTDDLEGERLEILNKLIVTDNKNEDIYIKEITELNQNSNIRKAIREVNKGRISVNIPQLRNNEENNIKEAFNRYKEIESYSKNKEIVGIDTSISMLNELTNINVEELLGNKIVYVNDPAFISFKVIFIEIRDKFLLSKEYGLDGYLSTRIRHGSLLNHIRSTFESENIISQRDKDNIYLENDFWNDTIPYSLSDKRIKIQEAIKKFSKSIDEYTEYIIKELIQVKTEKYTKKSKALFDYSISNSDLAFLFAAARENIKDYNLFLSFVFEYLQRGTEKILTRIRELINSEIKDNYNHILQDFNIEIKKILGTNAYPELTNAISLCGTRIQDELSNISEWFFLSNTSKDLELDLKVLIQTAIQITNTIHPNSKLNPKIKDEYSIPMVGTIHIIYICRILLDNILVHSKVNPNELDIEISSKITDDNFLEISFKNNLSDKVDKDGLNIKLEKVKDKWNCSSNDYENTDIEGGSGFEKIRRIIAFDLSCERYKFDYKIDNEFLTIKLSIEFLNIPEFNEEN